MSWGESILHTTRGRNLVRVFVLAVLVAIVSVRAYISWGPIAATTELNHPQVGLDRAVLMLAPGLAALALSESLPEGPMGSWGAALVNVRTGGGGYPFDAAATVSAGARAFGLNDLILAGSGDSIWTGEAADIYSSWYGRDIPPGGAAVLDYPRFIAAQNRLTHRASVGFLGDAFRDGGRATAFLQGMSSGSGIIVAADRDGIVDHYARCVATSVVTYGGWRTDWEQLAEAYDQLPPGVGLVVVEIAEMEMLAEWLPDDVRYSETAVFAGELGSFVDRMGEDTLVLLLDPLPGQGGMGLMMAPGSPGRLLGSPTTRRPGIVSLQDVGSTLLAAVGLGVEEGFGRPVGVTAPGDTGTLAYLVRLDWAMKEAGALRAPLAQAMAAGVVLASMVVIASLLQFPRLYSAAATSLGALSLLPLAAFLAPGLAGILPQLAALLVFWSVLVVIARSLTVAVGFRRSVQILAAVGLSLILVDQVGGGRWALLSPLGYSAAAGARYYGLGNEFLGVALGATVLVWAFGLGADQDRDDGPWPSMRWGDVMRGGLLLAATVIAASPEWGSNFGATMVFMLWLSGAAAHRLLPRQHLVFRRNPRLAWRLAGAACVLFALGLAGVLLWHGGSTPVSSTHVGRLLAGGTGEALWQVVARKLSTGIRLFRYTVWTRIWLFILAIYALVSFRPFGAVKKIFRGSPSLATVSQLAVALSVAALLTNDSGVVTAALTVMAPIAVTLLALEEEVVGQRTNSDGE